MTLSLTYAGFNYVADVDGSYTANSLPAMVSQTAANSVALTVDYGINASANSVYADYSSGNTTGNTESIANIETAAAEAKAAGQSVIIRPLIDFLPDATTAMLTGSNGNVYASGDWRAYYNPGTVAAGISFLQNYEQTVLIPLAQTAQTVGAAVFDIGTELDQLTGPAYQSTWDSIITTLKTYYTGKLTYSAIGNDDTSPWQYANDADPNIIAPPAAGTGDIGTQISFWNKLDYVGIDEYSALSNVNDTSLNGSNPTLQQLIDAWEQPFTDDFLGTPTDGTAEQTNGQSLIQYYESIATETGKPLLFTEIGYNSAPDAASQPFFTSSSAYDPALQAELYQAFFQAWKADGNASLKGVWFWNWEPDPTTVGAGAGPNWTPQDNTAALANTKAAFTAAESPACYCPGTLILTDHGEAAVEDLKIGGRVVTASGARRPIKWIGRRTYGGDLPVSPHVQPIRFRAGALGGGLPRRDLLVSPEHAMVVDGQLIPARALVNGRSIVRETGLNQVAYVHIELDSHDVLLAEGAPAESFLDDDSRGVFHNAREYRVLYPDEPPRPAQYCLPRLEEGEALEAIRLRLAALTEPPAPVGALEGRLDEAAGDRIIGWARDAGAPGAPVRLQISDNGVILGEVLADRFRADLAEAGLEDGRHAFELIVPGGLSPAISHKIEVRRIMDGHALGGSPLVIAAAEAPAVVALPAPEAPLVPWRGMLDSCTRERMVGWAQEPGSDAPVALQVLDNGLPLARILANRMRPDLRQAGIGDGAHGFDITIPGGLSPLTRHVIELRRVSDGAALPGSPVVLEAAHRFDAGLEQAVAAAVAALPPGDEQARVLSFMLAQAGQLARAQGEADGQRQARDARAKDQRRWGPLVSAGTPGLRALVINAALPATGHDGGSAALLSHMAALQRLGYAVSLVAADEMAADGAALAACGVSVCGAPFYSCVEDVLRRQAGCFDVVYLHRVDMATRYLGLTRQYMPRARVLYSVADLHHLRMARQAAVQDEPGLLALSHALRASECHAAAAADGVITHSPQEAAWLRRAAPGAQVHCVPWAVTAQGERPAFADRQGVAFIGHYGHAPNADAAAWLVGAVMPLVWQTEPAIECKLVGSAMPHAIQALAGPRVTVPGHVPQLAHVLDGVRLTVAPLRFGAGVKGKVLDSLAAGVPCVMTPVAAEGLELPPVLQAMAGADAAGLAALICAYHQDAARHEAAAQAGLALIRDRHNEAAVTAALARAIGVELRAEARCAG